ncbi:MAG: glycosyltransferase family 2 protein [Microscillaceae bacterium]|nr:glycosyltransferase family 2 protein [Microscillaceae bacterium]
MNHPPLVTVLMPVYNAGFYLHEAISSILNQTYSNFEFLIFNDGSTDQSKSIILSFHDTRIKFFDHPENFGHLKHLNTGIQMAQGKYIIRADADDLNYPQRIEKQISFLEANPHIGLCGSWVEIINTNGEPKYLQKYYVDDAFVRAHLFWSVAILHPTAVLRKSVLEQYSLNYKAEWYLAEDYALWIEMASCCCLANIPEALVQVRKHDQNISKTRFGEQKKLTDKLRIMQMARLEIQPNWEEWNTHEQLLYGAKKIDLSFVKSVNDWFEKLERQNQKTKAFPVPEFRKILQEHWYKITLGYSRLGLPLWWAFINNPLSEYRKFGFAFNIKFFIKAVCRI